MPNLEKIKSEVQALYKKSESTVDRYMILKEIEDHIFELRKSTVAEIENDSFKEQTALDIIHSILSDLTEFPVSVLREKITEETTTAEMFQLCMMDSLDFVEFIIYLENEFNVQITDEEAEGFKTVSEIVTYLNK